MFYLSTEYFVNSRQIFKKKFKSDSFILNFKILCVALRIKLKIFYTTGNLIYSAFCLLLSPILRVYLGDSPGPSLSALDTRLHDTSVPSLPRVEPWPQAHGCLPVTLLTMDHSGHRSSATSLPIVNSPRRSA